MTRITNIVLAVLFVVGWSAQAAQTKAQSDPAARLKKQVAAIVLEDGRTIKGRIVKVQKTGILFDPQRSSPFYDPPPRLFPLGSIHQMLDPRGKVIWRNPRTAAVKRASPKIGYRGAITVDGGPAFYLRTSRLPFAAAGWQNWKEAIQTVTAFKAEGMMLLKKRYGVGLAYERRATTATYTGILWSGSTGVQQIHNDKISLNTWYAKGYFWQPVSKALWVHFAGGIGFAAFAGEPFVDEPVRLNAPVFSAEGGADIFLTKETSFTAGFSFLFGRVGKETIGSYRLKFQHSLSQFTVLAGLRIWF